MEFENLKKWYKDQPEPEDKESSIPWESKLIEK